MTKKTEKREAKVLTKLQTVGTISMPELAEMLNVSLPTARRISNSLAKKHKLVRTHGGIKYFFGTEFEYSFDALKNQQVEEKNRIANYVSTLIKDGDIIFLEAGTTVQCLSLALAGRLREKKIKDIKIFTNSLNNLNILSPLCRVTLIGGDYKPARKAFTGYISEKVLKLLSFKYCFLGADAINLSEGIMATDFETVRLDELLVKRGEQSYILADSTKFTRKSFLSYASIHDVTKIITDNDLDQTIINEYKQNNIDLICV